MPNNERQRICLFVPTTTFPFLSLPHGNIIRTEPHHCLLSSILSPFDSQLSTLNSPLLFHKIRRNLLLPLFYLQQILSARQVSAIQGKGMDACRHIGHFLHHADLSSIVNTRYGNRTRLTGAEQQGGGLFNGIRS